MALTVLQVAFPFAAVGIDSVGGAEQVLAACEQAVVRAGHNSIVVACEGSRVAGELIAVPRVAPRDEAAARRAAHAAHKQAIDAAIARFGVDLVHCHGIDFAAYLPAEGAHVLVTLHLAHSLYAEAALRPHRVGTYFNCVSRSQYAACRNVPNLLPSIANGVDIERLRPDPNVRRRHALLLARICPEKGIHLAIEAAKQADSDLVIAGEVFPYAAHERYFADEVRPRLDGRRVFVGSASFEEKRKLLQSARCLLVPSLVDETSSLVAMEALACGTPVIAFRRGALPEIVEDGITGALIDNIEQMVAAIGKADAFQSGACVSAARRRFSAARMTREYLDLYERLSARTRQHVRRAAS
jgi:glycosyltransferase involved in cell wall biosynthesis